MNIAKLLDKTATVVPAGPGGTGTRPALPCCISPADPATVIAYAQQGITCVNLIYTGVDLGAAVGDHITIAGKSYPVVAVRSFDNGNLGVKLFVTACGAGT
jgi:hypothetical protein